MKIGKFTVLSLAIGLFLLFVAGCTMVVKPPQSSTMSTQVPPVTDIHGEFAAIQLILDIKPGAWTPVHQHGGPGMITVLDGVFTVRDDQGMVTHYQPGETWYEVPGRFHAAGNDGTTTTRIAVLFLLPKGAKLTTVKEGTNTGDLPPGPTLIYQHVLTVTNPLGEFEAIQLILDIKPGAWTPVHQHGGPGMITTLDGVFTVRNHEDVVSNYPPGETWNEIPGMFHAAGNDGTTTTRIAVLFLLPKGAKLTTVKEGTNTGDLPPGPTLVYQAKFTANSLAAP
jgi:quercetin dioxygenase-like cupin family protein